MSTGAGTVPVAGRRLLGRGAGLTERGFKRSDARVEGFVFFARETCHVLDSFKIFAPDYVEFAQDALGLAAEQRLELAPHPLRSAGGVIHQASNFVEKSVRRLHHNNLPVLAESPLAMLADNGDGAAQPQEAGAARGGTTRQRILRSQGNPMLVLPVLPYPAINPVLVHIGPLAVRWYALAYIVGILAGWVYARAIIASPRLWGGPAPLTIVDFDDFIIWITLGIILGGRIGYVLFYNLPLFLVHPVQIVELWHGGMLFHGGVLGCIVAIILFALHRGIPMLSLGDVTAAVAPIGLFLGRIANFINDELWGRPSNVPWAMIFPNGGPIPRHPSQLYEAGLEGIVLFIVLNVLVRTGALTRPGIVTGSFAVGYGIARITCEFFREPDPQLGFLWGGVTMGMLLCIPLILAGLAVLAFSLTYEAKPNDG